MQRWYLVHTKPCGETLAHTHLSRQGYDVYLPRIAQPVLRRGRWRDRIVALFPRYLFVRLREGLQTLGPIRSSTGVADVVRFGSRYAVVPDSIVDGLVARADPESGLHRIGLPAGLRPGSPVSIAMGAFDGLKGIFERTEGAERVVILLQLLGRDVLVRVPAGCVLSCAGAA
jgi:transcriptional antiterminator RfaH